MIRTGTWTISDPWMHTTNNNFSWHVVSNKSPTYSKFTQLWLQWHLQYRPIMTNLLVDEIGERYRLNHAIVVQVQAACQAVVCGTMCLQAACIAYITLLNWSHSAVYSTLINTALDLLGVGSTVTACLWTKIVHVTGGGYLIVIRNYTDKYGVCNTLCDTYTSPLRFILYRHITSFN